jgi:hypothetical protein
MSMLVLFLLNHIQSDVSPSLNPIFQPTAQPKVDAVYTTSAYLGSPRGCCNSLNNLRCYAVTAEVAGSSPVVPAINPLKHTGLWRLIKSLV